MINTEKSTIRTPVEDLLLSEMVMEDANFLIADQDGADDDMVIDNTSNGLFDDESDDDLFEDDYNEDEDRILGIY